MVEGEDAALVDLLAVELSQTVEQLLSEKTT